MRADVIDANDLGVGVLFPGGSEFDDVDAAVGADFHFDGAFEGEAGEERIDLFDLAFGVKADFFEPMAFPIVDEKALVVAGGEFAFGFDVGVEVIDRAGAGGAATGAEFGKSCRSRIWIGDECGL